MSSRRSGPYDYLPLFIGGCDRSGTTMLGAMLGAHSQCIAVPESQFKKELLPASEQSGRLSDEAVRHLAWTIAKHWRFKLWGTAVDPSQVPLDAIKGSYGRLIQWFVAAHAAVNDRQDATVWVDHTPSNSKYLVQLRREFPRLKLIHIVRDGRAVAASIIPLDWGPNTILHAAEWWAVRLAYGLAAERCLPPDDVIRVRYEDLVAQPEESLRRLTAFAGLQFEPQMVTGGGLKLAEYTQTQHSLVNARPDARRIDAWQHRLSARQIALFEALTGDLLPMLGYQLQNGGRPRSLARGDRIRLELYEFWQRQRNKRRYRRRLRETTS